MAAFTNLALSASQSGTKYLNKIFVIERGRYDELGVLMISVAVIGLIVPVITVLLFNPARQIIPAATVEAEKNLANESMAETQSDFLYPERIFKP